MQRKPESDYREKGDTPMFEQLDDPELAGRKSWKERLVEGAMILVVAGVVIGAVVYAFMTVE
jgi:hypothetical protein